MVHIRVVGKEGVSGQVIYPSLNVQQFQLNASGDPLSPETPVCQLSNLGLRHIPHSEVNSP